MFDITHFLTSFFHFDINYGEIRIITNQWRERIIFYPRKDFICLIIRGVNKTAQKLKEFKSYTINEIQPIKKID